MKEKIILVFALALLTNMCVAQNKDSIAEPKVKSVFPGITLGTNYTSYWNAEASFLLGLTNTSEKATKIHSMLMHGPTFGFQLARYNHAFRAAPKFSYEYYTNFWGGRICVVDYLDDGIHSIYVSPEAGLSFGSFLNLFFGVNLPVSDAKIAEVKTFRFSATVDLLFFYFEKDKSKRKA